MEVVRSTEMAQSSFFIYADKYGKILVLWLAHKFHAESLLRLIPSTFQFSDRAQTKPTVWVQSGAFAIYKCVSHGLKVGPRHRSACEAVMLSHVRPSMPLLVLSPTRLSRTCKEMWPQPGAFCGCAVLLVPGKYWHITGGVPVVHSLE